MTPTEALELMRQSQTDAHAEIVDVIEQRHKRRLHGSREDQAAHEGTLAAWEQLLGGKHIEHHYGRSFERPGCPECFGHMQVGKDQRPCGSCGGRCRIGSIAVFGYPADHLDGVCFECSGVDAPEGFSQAERQARAAAVAELPKLRMLLR